MKTPKGDISDKILELVKDEKVLEEMSKAGSPEECYDIVKDRLHISFEDFKSSMEVAQLYLSESQAGLLNEDDLEQVAGGKSDNVKLGFDAFFGTLGSGAAVISAVVAAAVG